MITKEKNGVRWLEFELFQNHPEVSHGIFLKHGGFSTGVFDSLNFGRNLGDPDDIVTKNIAKARESLAISKVAFCNQVHGADILEANTEGFLGHADAMVTKIPEIGLLVKHADCQAAVFYDPVKKVIGNVHSGWRGNVKNIYSETVKHFQKFHQSNPADILVGISPSLGPEDAEFLNYRTELPEHFWKFQTKPFHFDLWEISRQQLLEAGILDKNIEISGISTLSNPEDFFSYRRLKVSGRHGTFIVLKSL